MTRVAFDVDGTLIRKEGNGYDMPRHDVIDLFRWFEKHGHQMYLWSGGGMSYAMQWGMKLGLQSAIILTKDKKHNIDIAVDDEIVDLAKINIKV